MPHTASHVVTGNTEETRPENRAFYPALDGLRAIAFLMVFFQHYMEVPWGWTGVNVFFVLSGFLITGILFDSRDKPNRARNFYLRRTLRIFPLYYGIFLLLLLLSPIMHWYWNWQWVAWPLYLGNFLRFASLAATHVGSGLELAANGHLGSPKMGTTDLFFGHFWSLCVEEQFYLFWPWIVFWVRSRRALLWICGITVVAVPLLRLIAQSSAPRWMVDRELLYRLTPFQLDSLLLGGLVALLWRAATTQSLHAHRERLLLAGRILAGVCAFAAIIYLGRTLHLSNPNWRKDYLYPEWRLTWGLSFVDVFTAAVILCCLRANGWLSRILCFPPLRWLGRISYGAYVFHDIPFIPILHAIFWLGPRSHFVFAHAEPCQAMLGLVFTLLISWLSFRFFETPFLNLKERLTRSH